MAAPLRAAAAVLLAPNAQAAAAAAALAACGRQLRAGAAFSTQGQQAGDDDTADFGFRQVPRDQKAGLVGEVFHSVASSYDVMNDLMSAGLHRVWKDRLVEVLRPFAGMRHLDVAGGTGDVAFRVLAAIHAAEAAAAGRPPPAPGAAAGQPQQEGQQRRPGGGGGGGGRVTVCDINGSMLEVGRAKAAARGLLGSTDWVQGDAEALPIADESVDAYTIAFGIRNVTDRPAALREALRVLKPGGRFLCLEFSQVTQPLLRQAYDAYSFAVIPRIGQLVAGDAESYRYLVESIRRFPDQDAFAALIREAGFRAVTYENMTHGVVALHSGFKL
ncbi:MAG: 2-methoxy-6-polyprenyl-1,4-benzoquinol methylase, mitochondrial precursor [Monoraphidium minutum]|nr:MAG: 2-methoxy-6-polyprenyl-1,4-benzoquinol methylase, mitochondrial precursor [Monoraphidium minutum]